MQIFSSDRFVLPLPAGHRFPMQKYARLRQRVSEANLTPSNELCTPPAATDEQILRAHDWDYWYRVQTGQLTTAEQRRIGFPWSEALVERTQRSAGATIRGRIEVIRHRRAAGWHQRQSGWRNASRLP